MAKKVVLSVLLCFFALWLISWESAQYYNPCNNNNECTNNDFVSGWVVGLVDIFDKHESAITAFSTILLAIFTWRLWVSTDRLWLAGEKQRDVSERAIDVSRKTGEAQVRAYLTCIGGEIEYSRISCEVNIKLINKGQSPASNVIAKSSLHLILRSGLLTVDPIAGANAKFIERRSKKPGPLIAAGESGVCKLAWVSLDVLTGTSFSSIMSFGVFRTELRGEVTWTDVFGKQQTLPFKLIADNEGRLIAENQTPENPKS